MSLKALPSLKQMIVITIGSFIGLSPMLLLGFPWWFIGISALAQGPVIGWLENKYSRKADRNLPFKYRLVAVFVVNTVIQGTLLVLYAKTILPNLIFFL